MKFNIRDSHKFGWEGLNGWAFNSKEDFPNASAAYFEVTGEHGRTRTKLSDRIYYVLGGEAQFEVDNDKFLAKSGEVIIIPQNTPYNYRAVNGTLKLFLVHTPAFDPNFELKE